MASSTTNLKGESAQSSLKQKMAQVMEECAKYRQLCEKSTRDLEEAKARRAQLEIDLGLANRKLNLLEGDFDQQNAKFNSTSQKLNETTAAVVECDRQKRYLENRLVTDEEKLTDLEQFMRESSEVAVESEKRYDDVSRKLLMTETELERAEARSEASVGKVNSLEADMKSLALKLKSMQSKVEKTSKREELFDKSIDDLRAQLTEAEKRGSEADRTISKLQSEIDKMQDEVLQTKMQYQSLREELDPCAREIRAN